MRYEFFRRLPKISSRHLIALIVLIGTAVRIGAYLNNPSLWVDEGSLGLNVLTRNLRQLCEPLDNNQAAPLLFLLLSKLSTLLFGVSELGLRFIPAASGILALWLMPALCRAAKLSPGESVIATLMLAVTPMCIEYGCQFKQYEGDVLATVILATGALTVAQNLSASRALFSFGVLGAVLPWFSHASVFMVAAAGCVLGRTAIRLRDPRAIGTLVVITAVWTASFAVNYVFFSSQAAKIPRMVAYWDEVYQAFAPHDATFPSWFFDKVITLPRYFGWSLPLLAVGVSLVGTASLAARVPTRDCCLLFVVAFVLALIASMLRKYPFANRLILWLAVPMSIFFAVGLHALRHVGREEWKFCAALILAGVCYNPTKQIVLRTFRPEKGSEDLRTVLFYACDHSNLREPLVAVGNTSIVATYYHRINVPIGLRERPLVTLSAEACRAGLQQRLSPGEHFWLLFSHLSDAEIGGVQKSVQGVATRVDESASVGASGSRWIMK
jgi:hypothetical protein